LIFSIGSRPQVALLREEISVGRRLIRRLMRKLEPCALRPKRNTSKEFTLPAAR
jgi:hypothetical protein